MECDRVAGRVLARTWHRLTCEWRGSSIVAVGLAAWVVTGWLVVAGVAAATMPDTASTPTGGFVAVVGRTARIHQPGIPGWPIPTDRRAYDAYYLGVEEDDAGVDQLFTTFEWIQVEHHQAVRIIEVDGEAHHVELLEGRNAGRSGWLKTRHLGP